MLPTVTLFVLCLAPLVGLLQAASMLVDRAAPPKSPAAPLTYSQALGMATCGSAVFLTAWFVLFPENFPAALLAGFTGGAIAQTGGKPASLPRAAAVGGTATLFALALGGLLARLGEALVARGVG